MIQFRKSRICRYCGLAFEANWPSKQHCSFDCRFWAKVTIGLADECWPWIGAIIPKSGYGNFTIKEGLQESSHRIAFRLSNGGIPNGLHVCHTCDNPPCCNPKHLFCGTAKDNSVDMHSKGRWHNEPARGEDQGLAVLTEGDVRNIRARLSAETGRSLATEFGVSESTVSQIRRNVTWCHVA